MVTASGSGGGHLPHIARRNVNVNYILFDNSIYGLTKGQPSPSTPIGTRTKASPHGSQDTPLNGTLLALSYGASFVARLFAGDPESIREALVEGFTHNGFSFFHVYTPCVTFDKQFKTWNNLNEKTHPLHKGFDPTDRKAAINQAMDDEYAMGIFYRRES